MRKSVTLDDCYATAKILIVDDEEATVRLLDDLLKDAGYRNRKCHTDSRHVLPLFQAYQPDLILLDLVMPNLDGFAVMTQLKTRVPVGEYLPILVITGDISRQGKERALSLGVKDFVTKPFDRTEVLLRIRNLLETRFLHCRLQDQNQLLEEKVWERTRELEETRIEVLDRLGLAAEYRDDETGRHTQRVGRTSAILAEVLGLPEAVVELIRRASPLHDVGKIGISDTILLKPEKLTDEEFDLMKTHVTLGGRIVSGSRYALLQMAEEIALYHHERWDGTGYAGLAGEAIPLSARIVTVADVFDALTHVRPYKKAWPLEEAVSEIVRQSGRQFDPRVVEAFSQALDRGHLNADGTGVGEPAIAPRTKAAH